MTSLAGAAAPARNQSDPMLETQTQAEPVALSEEERIWHCLARFSLGPTAASMHEVRELGIEAWFEGQLAGDQPAAPALRERLASLPSLELTSRQLVDEYYSTGEEAEKEGRSRFYRRTIPSRELRDSVVLNAVYSPNQLREAAADFFRNHFCVALGKPIIKFTLTDYEREVIKRRVFGRFHEMLVASAKHPAMLEYLDNAVSRRAPTKAELKLIEMRERAKTGSKEAGLTASSIASQRGLNENYARELLELHTLGVDNHYDQTDVENVARALTGWSFQLEKGEPIDFAFRADYHAGGSKKVLHKLIRDDWKDPVGEGEAVLELLAEHSGTAHFLAWKLCRHFVNDEPSEELVARVARVFEKSKGDLPSVYRAILHDADFFSRANFRTKFKRPFEFVVSALRATGAEVEGFNGIMQALQSMNEDLYNCQDPTGYYDQAEAWLDPGALAVRWRFARELASGGIEGVRVPDALWAELDPQQPPSWKAALVARLLPIGLSAQTESAIDQLVAERCRGGAIPSIGRVAPLIVSVILGSPDFQRQ